MTYLYLSIVGMVMLVNCIIAIQKQDANAMIVFGVLTGISLISFILAYHIDVVQNAIYEDLTEKLNKLNGESN